MVIEGENLVWEPLRSNESFLDDLRQFFAAPTELLKVIAQRTKVHPYVPLSNTESEELAGEYDETAVNLQRISAVLLFLKQRLIDTGQELEAAVAEFRELLENKDLIAGREEEIMDILSYSKEEREEALVVQAFSGGPAFLDTRIRPSLLPVSVSSDELVGGYLWTISYLNAEGEQRSVTVGLTPGELEQLEKTIGRAKEQLRKIKNFATSAQETKG